MAERASDRLLRMLGMVAYLDSHGDVPVDDLAAQFGVTPEQVLADVDTLWVTGTPGYLPYDLIDFDATAYERGVVTLVEARGMTRPLRLGGREAVAAEGSRGAAGVGHEELLRRRVTAARVQWKSRT